MCAWKARKPLTFLYLKSGKGYAFEGRKDGQHENGFVEGIKKDVTLADMRKLGIRSGRWTKGRTVSLP